MSTLIDCSNCRTTVQLPPGASVFRCAVCQAVTRIADSGSSVTPSPVNGRKRAVICGISYKGTEGELDGCINDAKCMKHLLMNRFNFPESGIMILTEEETDIHRIPTIHNIRMAMYWLVHDCKPGDSLVFHFSGHGEKEDTGDEIDGYEGALCPLDVETHGVLGAREINETLVRPIPHGVKLHAIIDACHSGSMLYLPFRCRMNRSGLFVWEDHRPQSGLFTGTSGGEVLFFSGCDDEQTSSDSEFLSKVASTGAMTYSFIKAIELGNATTYGNLLTSIRTTIREYEIDETVNGQPLTYALGMLLAGESPSVILQQEPQLTSSETFDVYTKRFSL